MIEEANKIIKPQMTTTEKLLLLIVIGLASLCIIVVMKDTTYSDVDIRANYSIVINASDVLGVSKALQLGCYEFCLDNRLNKEGMNFVHCVYSCANMTNCENVQKLVLK